MNDFDFFTGTWVVRNRWRTSFLDENSEWEEDLVAIDREQDRGTYAETNLLDAARLAAHRTRPVSPGRPRSSR